MTTRNSTTRQAQKKASKPRPDFPLFPHQNGRWRKKVRQKFHYFGRVDEDPNGQAALALWLDQKDDLLVGRTPPGCPRRVDRQGVLVDAFLNAKKAMVDTGELVLRSWSDYHRSCGRVVAVFGRHRFVDDLDASDFGRLRTELAKTLGPVSLANEIQRIRVLFKWGFAEGLLRPALPMNGGLPTEARICRHKRRPTTHSLRRHQ